MSDTIPGNVFTRALATLWGLFKKNTDQTNKPGREGTLIGRLLESSVPHPIIQLAVPILDPLLAKFWDRVVDPDQETPTTEEFKAKLKEALLENKESMRAHYIGFLNYAFQKIDLPVVDGALESLVEEQAVKAVDSFIQWQIKKL